jgi:hypothetical protein
MIDQLVNMIGADPLGFLRGLLELGWPAIVLLMVVTLYRRDARLADETITRLNGEAFMIRQTLDACQGEVRKILAEHDASVQRFRDETTTQLANNTLMARQNRDDILRLVNILTNPQG